MVNALASRRSAPFPRSCDDIPRSLTVLLPCYLGDRWIAEVSVASPVFRTLHGASGYAVVRLRIQSRRSGCEHSLYAPVVGSFVEDAVTWAGRERFYGDERGSNGCGSYVRLRYCG